MRRAACVLIFRNDKVLAISRGENTLDWGIPGGKVERRETLLEAARNELREETGVHLDVYTKLVPILTDLSHTHVTTTFGVNGLIFYPKVLRSDPFEGYVDWKGPHELCSESCSFAAYHAKVFRKLGIL